MATITDTQYTQAAPFSVTANTPVALPNNGEVTGVFENGEIVTSFTRCRVMYEWTGPAGELCGTKIEFPGGETFLKMRNNPPYSVIFKPGRDNLTPTLIASGNGTIMIEAYADVQVYNIVFEIT